MTDINPLDEVAQLRDALAEAERERDWARTQAELAAERAEVLRELLLEWRALVDSPLGLGPHFDAVGRWVSFRRRVDEALAKEAG